MSDINIGQISEALNDKMDRDAHNVQSPSAVVIEKQDPTSENGYTWYRKYSDGWVEQGRFINGGTWSSYALTDTLPVPMQDANYTAMITPLGVSEDTYITNVNSRTATTISIRRRGGGSGCYWMVCGTAA